LRIKGFLIIKKSKQDKRFFRTTMGLKKLDEKYCNFKNILEEWNLGFINV